MDMNKVMMYLVDRQAPGLPPRALAEVFDMLIWCMEDNGAEIEKVRSEWLMSNNKNKIEIALEMSQTCPFKTVSEMVPVLNAITSNWPSLKGKCLSLREKWEKILPS